MLTYFCISTSCVILSESSVRNTSSMHCSQRHARSSLGEHQLIQTEIHWLRAGFHSRGRMHLRCRGRRGVAARAAIVPQYSSLQAPSHRRESDLHTLLSIQRFLGTFYLHQRRDEEARSAMAHSSTICSARLQAPKIAGPAFYIDACLVVPQGDRHSAGALTGTFGCYGTKRVTMHIEAELPRREGRPPHRMHHAVVSSHTVTAWQSSTATTQPHSGEPKQ